MANPDHVAAVREGGVSVAGWRRKFPEGRLDLAGADLAGLNLRGLNLAGANLRRASLTGANLTWANLTEAVLSGADLSMCDLIEANLARARLFDSKLNMATLTGSNLTGAYMGWADLRGDLLIGVNLTGAVFANTAVGDCDLSQCLGLGKVVHEYASSIGIDTLIASYRGASNRLTPSLHSFFRGAGVPEELLQALPHIVAELRYHSCLIAFGEPDREFAQRLCEELTGRRVSCWVHPMEGTPGRGIWRGIGEKRSRIDRLVALCSAASLAQDEVLREIEDRMDEAPGRVIAVSLDDSWKRPGFRVVGELRDLKPFLLERSCADFGEGKDYEQALQRLLQALGRNG